jgi:hypothetical protein
MFAALLGQSGPGANGNAHAHLGQCPVIPRLTLRVEEKNNKNEKILLTLLL